MLSRASFRPASNPIYMPDYHPEIIRSFANRLYARAPLVVLASTILGVLIGLVGAPFILQSLPPSWAVRCPEWVVVALLGLIGLGQGMERAFLMKLNAQQALCQLEIERNTRARPGDPTGVT